jgi:hypothetical protein
MVGSVRPPELEFKVFRRIVGLDFVDVMDYFVRKHESAELILAPHYVEYIVASRISAWVRRYGAAVSILPALDDVVDSEGSEFHLISFLRCSSSKSSWTSMLTGMGSLAFQPNTWLIRNCTLGLLVALHPRIKRA